MIGVFVQRQTHSPRLSAPDAPGDVVVADTRDASRDWVVVREHGDPQPDLAALARELDAVVDDVDESLPKTELVAADVEPVELWRDVQHQLHLVLVRLVTDDVHELVDHLVDVERFDDELLVHAAAALQLCEIENLTDDPEKRLRGDYGGRDKLPLGLRQGVVL